MGYWKLDEGAGAPTIADSSGNGYVGAIQGGSTFGVAGKLSSAASFDGASGYVDLGTILNPGANPMSIAVWFNTSNPSQGQGIIYNKENLYESAVINGYYQYAWQPDWNWDGGTSFPVSANNWYHAVIVYDGVNQYMYRNGILVYSRTQAGNIGSGSAKLLIGARGDTVPTNFFQGTVDDLAIWNSALTASQIQTIYQRQSAKYSGQLTSRVMDGLANGQSWTTLASTSTLPFYKELPGSSGSESSSDYSSQSANLMNGIVGLWHLNEPTGTSGAGSVVDSSGQGNNGTPGGSMTLGNQGTMGTAGDFSGGAVSVADAASLKPSSAITVSAWLNPRNISTWDSALMKSSNGSWIDGYGLSHYTTADNTVNFWINNYLTNYVRVTLSLHSWQHVVGTYDGSTLKIYLNGILSDSLAYSASINNSTDPLFIGSGSNGAGSPGYPWNGYVDEVAIWSRALSNTEVLELYRRGANRLKHQIRSCSASDCSDQEALSNKGWKGPDNTDQSYFSELYNTTSNVLAGTVLTGSPIMTFANFSGSGLSVTANRYFQYRTILESDDENSLCNYGAGATACSPELKSVSIGPTHYDSTAQTITSKASIGSAYQTLDVNGFTETLGANSCSAGVRYALSPDGTTFYYWNGSAWATSSDYATASDGATVRSNLSTFPSAAGTGTLQIKTFLKSNGTSACEVDSLQVTGKRN